MNYALKLLMAFACVLSGSVCAAQMNLPFYVYDANNKFIGYATNDYVPKYNVGDSLASFLSVYDKTTGVYFGVDVINQSVAEFYGSIYFVSTDCTGTMYTNGITTPVFKHGDDLLVSEKEPISGLVAQSYKSRGLGSPCSSLTNVHIDNPYKLIKYAGAVPFSFPLALPLKFTLAVPNPPASGGNKVVVVPMKAQ